MLVKQFQNVVVMEVRRNSSFINHRHSDDTIRVLDKAYRENSEFKLSDFRIEEIAKEIGNEFNHRALISFTKETIRIASFVKELNPSFDYGYMHKDDFIVTVARSLKTDNKKAIEFIDLINDKRSNIYETKLLSMALEGGYKKGV